MVQGREVRKSSNPTGSRVILPAPVEELSVAHNEHLDQFVLLTSMASGVVSMPVADNPEVPGPPLRRWWTVECSPTPTPR